MKGNKILRFISSNLNDLTCTIKTGTILHVLGSLISFVDMGDNWGKLGHETGSEYKID